MRDFIIILTILVFVFIGGELIQNYLVQIDEDLVKHIDSLHDEIVSGNMSNKEKVLELVQLWEKAKTKWHILGNHSEIDEIEAELSRFEEAYSCNEPVEAAISTAVMRFRIMDMHKGEKFELVNIL